MMMNRIEITTYPPSEAGKIKNPFARWFFRLIEPFINSLISRFIAINLRDIVRDVVMEADLQDSRLLPDQITTPISDSLIQERAAAIVTAAAEEQLREEIERLVEETLELKPIRVEMQDGKLTLKLVGKRMEARGEV